MNYTDLLLMYLAGAAIKLDKSLWQIKSTRSARLIPTLTFTPVLVSVIQRKEKPWTETLIKTNALRCGQIERTACRNLGYVMPIYGQSIHHIWATFTWPCMDSLAYG